MPEQSQSTSDPGLKAAALAYETTGWRVVPLHNVGPDGLTCSCNRGRNCTSKGKHPRIKEWQREAIDIEEAWTRWPKANVGLATGEASGFWVLDIDPDGMEAFGALIAEHGKLPETRTVKTPRGTWHYYFRLPDDFIPTNSSGRLPKGVDVRGAGGQVVAPPSVTDNGAYKRVGKPLIVAAPAWLLELIRPTTTAAPVPTQVAEEPESVDVKTVEVETAAPVERARLDTYTQRAIDGEIERLEEMKAKGWDGPPWNNTTYQVACNLLEIANSGWNEYDTSRAYSDLFENAPRDGNFDDEVVNKVFKSAVAKVGEKSRPKPAGQDEESDSFFDNPDIRVDPALGGGGQANSAANGGKAGKTPLRAANDLGNGERMRDHYADRVRYVVEAAAWSVYSDGRWSMDGKVSARWYAQQMVSKKLAEEEPRHSDTFPPNPTNPNNPKTYRQLFHEWRLKQATTARIDSALKEASSLPELRSSKLEFDSDPMLFNVANCVINLATGEPIDHASELLLMTQSPVHYDPAAKAPMWEEFLAHVQPDEEMRRYLQRIVGYSLTGHTTEQAMFLHHGATGSNGKSVFLQVMTGLFGDYGQVVPRSTLLMKRNEEHPTSVARMIGKRFLQTSETKDGRSLDEEVVKGLTGGEEQSARYMGENFFDFKPTGKIHYITNHLPRLTDANSIWRRMHLIGWRVTIADEDQDKYLGDKIVANELSGILNWAIEGCLDWQKAGTLERPRTMREDLAEYREDMDIFMDFLRQKTVPSPGNRLETKELYAAYTHWEFTSGIKNHDRLSIIDFGRKLAERGFQRWRTGAKRGVVGLELVSEVRMNSDLDAFFGAS